MDDFLSYRTAYDEMESDTKVLDIRERIEELQDQLSELEASYRGRMNEAEAKIKTLVFEERKSVTLHGVYAKYTKGARRTSWKSVAEEMKAPAPVISKHTKVGEPRVTVEVV